MRYPKVLTFAIALGLLSSPFINVSQTEAATSTPDALVVSNGTVYLITSDSRRPYPSTASFLSYKLNSWANITPASAEDLALTEGAFIPPREGAIVCSDRGADKGTCYLITNSKKAAFVSAAVFGQLGFSFAQALTGDTSFLEPTDIISDGSAAHRPGVLVNSKGTLYVVGNNGLMGVPDEQTLRSWGYSVTEAVPANANDQALGEKLTLIGRLAGELRPYEPTLPPALTLANEDKFVIPLSGPDLPEITETWLYSPTERAIHGFTLHGAVDFAAPRGTPVYAAADGYAISSTHLSPLDRTYNGKNPVGFGLGEFVQIWHPDQGVYTSYSHLSRVSSKIPYIKPECSEGGFCDPKVVYHDTDYIVDRAVFIKQGTLIGYIGDSGLGWGYLEGPRKKRPDPETNPSWDETHLHFEIYTRAPEKFTKQRRYDPFGLYNRLNKYTAAAYEGSAALWKLDAQGHPVFAK